MGNNAISKGDSMKLTNIRKEMNKITDQWVQTYHVEGHTTSYTFRNVEITIQHSGTDHATCGISVKNLLKLGDARFDDVGDFDVVYKLKHLVGSIKTRLVL
jgi:hypothetical protein